VKIKYRVVKQFIYGRHGEGEIDTLAEIEFYDVNLAIECYKRWVEEGKRLKLSNDYLFEITVEFEGKGVL
tara:strand:+ start:584 stop:793 length:210 start_codon:yes stop_codon:yes gene_type:complete